MFEKSSIINSAARMYILVESRKIYPKDVSECFESIPGKEYSRLRGNVFILRKGHLRLVLWRSCAVYDKMGKPILLPIETRDNFMAF